jgi:hypothetical protein
VAWGREHLYLLPGLPGESGEAHAVAEQPEPDRTTLSAEELAWAEHEGGWFAVVARAMTREHARRGTASPASLVSLPYAPIGYGRCRNCCNLNYASQHYGRGNVLRRQLPPRRALTRRRRRQRAERERQKVTAKCQAERQHVPLLSPEEAERAVADAIALAEKLGMRRMPDDCYYSGEYLELSSRELGRDDTFRCGSLLMRNNIFMAFVTTLGYKRFD